MIGLALMSPLDYWLATRNSTYRRYVDARVNATIRVALKLLPVLEKAFRRRKRSVGRSWRMDGTQRDAQLRRLVSRCV
ncbi:hypothetical protein PTKU46_53200 [Paraburkholderia terrae]